MTTSSMVHFSMNGSVPTIQHEQNQRVRSAMMYDHSHPSTPFSCHSSIMIGPSPPPSPPPPSQSPAIPITAVTAEVAIKLNEITQNLFLCLTPRNDVDDLSIPTLKAIRQTSSLHPTTSSDVWQQYYYEDDVAVVALNDDNNMIENGIEFDTENSLQVAYALHRV